jgi:hypothetical protein
MKFTKTLKKGTQRTQENRIDTKHIKGEEKNTGKRDQNIGSERQQR